MSSDVLTGPEAAPARRRERKPPAPSPHSDLLTTKEACALLRCAPSTLYAMFHRKLFKRAKIGGATRWRKSQLERYIEMQTRAAR